MDKRFSSKERKVNVWAPWRMEYIDSLGEENGCFLCKYRDEPENDRENLVLWRRRRNFVVLNRFPYTGGHCMVAPYDHLGDLSDLDGETMLEMMELVRDLKGLLAHAIRAEGFNIGINIGRCAGAGLPEHLHLHIVPRWGGDTNFMSVFSDVRVISTALDSLYAKLLSSAEELQLPRTSEKSGG